MKAALLIFFAALMPTVVCRGQAAAVYDDLVYKRVGDAVTQLITANANLVKLLSTADDQLNELKKFTGDTTAIKNAIEEQVDVIKQVQGVIGDPDAVKPAGYNTVRDKVQAWIDDGKLPDPPKYDKDITDPTSPGDGDQAFSKATAGGLFASITDKYKPDPTKDDTQPRDPKLYTGAVNELASVKEYFQNREASLKRRDDLQSLLKDTLDDVKNAKDFATLEKYSVLLEAIQAQLKACTDDMNASFNDVAVRAVQMFAMSQIKQTADNEAMNKVMNDKMTQLTDGVKSGGSGTTGGGTVSGGSYSAGLLPWKHYSY